MFIIKLLVNNCSKVTLRSKYLVCKIQTIVNKIN